MKRYPLFFVFAGWMMGMFPLNAALPPLAKVIEVSGNVSELKYEREEKSHELKLFDLLYVQDVVATGPSSTARLLVLPEVDKEKTAFFLYENSRFKMNPSSLTKPGQKRLLMYLSRGFLRAFVKGLKPGQDILIQTPHGVIGVRGTLLEVQVGGGETSVLIDEGKAFWVKVDKRGLPSWEKVLELKSGTRYQFNQTGDMFETIRGSLLNVDNRIERISISNLMPTINDAHSVSNPSPDAAGQAGFINQQGGINKNEQSDVAKGSSEVSKASADERADMVLKPGF